MVNSGEGEVVKALLRRLEVAIEAQASQLATIERRVVAIHEQCARTGELATRLKLMADNARESASAQAQAIADIANRIVGRPH